jgi:hypothetical protein
LEGVGAVFAYQRGRCLEEATSAKNCCESKSRDVMARGYPKSRLPCVVLRCSQGLTSGSNLCGATTLPTTLSALFFGSLDSICEGCNCGNDAAARQCSPHTAVCLHPSCGSCPPSVPLSTVDTTPHSPLHSDSDSVSASSKQTCVVAFSPIPTTNLLSPPSSN